MTRYIYLALRNSSDTYHNNPSEVSTRGDSHNMVLGECPQVWTLRSLPGQRDTAGDGARIDCSKTILAPNTDLLQETLGPLWAPPGSKLDADEGGVIL